MPLRLRLLNRDISGHELQTQLMSPLVYAETALSTTSIESIKEGLQTLEVTPRPWHYSDFYASSSLCGVRLHISEWAVEPFPLRTPGCDQNMLSEALERKFERYDDAQQK